MLLAVVPVVSSLQNEMNCIPTQTVRNIGRLMANTIPYLNFIRTVMVPQQNFQWPNNAFILSPRAVAYICHFLEETLTQ